MKTNIHFRLSLNKLIFGKGFSFISTIIFLILFSCSPENYTDDKIISIEGEGLFFNYSKSDLGYVLSEELDSTIHLLAEAGDLIVFDDYIYYFNDHSDKTFVLTENDGILFNHGLPLAVNLNTGNQKKIAEVLQNNNLSQLHSIEIGDQLTPETVDLLSNLAGSFTQAGLVIRDFNKLIQKTILLLQPTWLYIESIDLKSLDFLEKLPKLEMLAISINDSLIDTSLPAVPGLKHLLIMDLPARTVIAPEFLSQHKQLRSLACCETKLSDFSFVEKLSQLNSLNLSTEKDTLLLPSFEQMPKLNSLGLIGEEYKNLEALDNLKKLKWLTIAGNCSQQTLNALLLQNQRLAILQLVNCSQVETLTPLKKMKQLEALVISEKMMDQNTIPELNQLKYLSIPYEAFDDSIYHTQLKQALPECIVVPNDGLCMGSGWLILFLPLVLIVFGIKFIVKK